MIFITPDRPLTLNLAPYQPPAELTAVLPRFLARTHPDGAHQIWDGDAARSRTAAPRIDIRGQTLSVFDYAYRAFVDDIWPHLAATSACDTPRCVAPAHLRLARAARRPRPLLEADWDELARRLYLTGARRPHRHLRDENAIERIYEAPEAWFELARRNTRLAHSITNDAPRIALA